MVVQSFLWALAQQEDIKPQVIQCYQRLSQLGNVMAQHKLAVLTGPLLPSSLYLPSSGEGKSTYSVNPEYPKRIFDDMAPVFEKRLVQDLGYNCPWKMRELVDQLLESSQVSSFLLSCPHPSLDSPFPSMENCRSWLWLWFMWKIIL